MALKMTWGIAKITVSLLLGLALPLLFFCVIFVGGVAQFVPVVMIMIAAGIVKLSV